MDDVLVYDTAGDGWCNHVTSDGFFADYRREWRESQSVEAWAVRMLRMLSG